MKTSLILTISCLVLLSSCNKDDDPISPSNNPFRAVFSEKFNDESDWQYHVQEFDSNGASTGYINPNFFFSNGMAELTANQGNNCDRKALTKSITNTQEIIDIIESDTLSVSIKLDAVEYSALGWSSIIIALDSNNLRFSFRAIEEAKTYTFNIARWGMYDLTVKGESDPAGFIFANYSNNPDALGTDKIIIKADACGADLGASARIVVDEITLAVQTAEL